MKDILIVPEFGKSHRRKTFRVRMSGCVLIATTFQPLITEALNSVVLWTEQ
jgi:hypothetical protein